MKAWGLCYMADAGGGGGGATAAAASPSAPASGANTAAPPAANPLAIAGAAAAAGKAAAGSPGDSKPAAAGVEVPSWLPSQFIRDGKPDYEALAKGYGELRTKLDSTRPADKPPGETPKAEEKPKAGDGPKRSRTKTEAAVEAKVGGSLLNDAKVDFVANNGAFSKEMTARLVSSGYSAEEVPQIASMILGEYTALYERLNTDVFSGKLGEVMEWQKSGLPPAFSKEIDGALMAGGESMVLGMLALKGAHDLLTGGGSLPELGIVEGGGSEGELYATEADYNKAQADPRYLSDPEFMRAVDARMAKSAPKWSNKKR